MTQSINIDRITFHLRNLSIPLFIVLIAGAIVFSIWYYRGTVPPVYGWTKRVVTMLRISALIILIIGIAEPIINLVKTVTNRFAVAVLIDTSSSINKTDDPSRKSEALETLHMVRSKMGEQGVFFAFDDQMRKLEHEEPVFDGKATDILAAIKNAAAQKNVSSLIVVSDGIWNLGEDPAGSGLPDTIPIHTVIVGSDELDPDVFIKKVSAAPIGREGSALPVEITVTSNIEHNDPIPVEVLENNITAASGTVSLRSETTARITLDIPLEKPGDHIFTVAINPSEDSQANNNTRKFSVHVIKSSFNVLMIAAFPSPDLGFIRRIIEADNAFDLKVAVAGTLTGESENVLQYDISMFDTVILLDGGGKILTHQWAESLAKWVAKGGSLWLLGSSPPDSDISALEGILPVKFLRGVLSGDSEFFTELTESGRTHFITTGIEGRNSERDWSLLPPLSSISPVSSVPSKGLVLAQAVFADQKKRLPAIVTGKHGSGKILVMPFSGIWRWRLMMEGAGKEDLFFSAFVMGTFRWLTSDTETSPLSVTTDQRSYLSGQEISFEGRLFDNIYTPVSGADISLIIDDDPSLKVILEETSPAVYHGKQRSIKPGEHVFSAVAYIGNNRFAESSDSFSVEQISLDMFDSKPDPALMGTIAKRTGGIGVTFSGIDSIFTSLQPRFNTERYTEKHHVYLSPFMPFVIVILLAVEWGIRKRRGML